MVLKSIRDSSKSEVTEYQNDDSLKPFILLVVDRKEEGLKAANDLLQNKCKSCHY